MTLKALKIVLRINLQRNLFVALCLTLLVGCGFTLRGTEGLNSQFSTLELNLQQENSPFAQILRRSLDSAGVSITESPFVLSVGNEQSDARPVTINTRARAAQYALRVAVEVSLHSNGESIAGPETLWVERTYFEDIENIVGSTEEVEILKAEMRQELVEQIIRGLEAINLN